MARIRYGRGRFISVRSGTLFRYGVPFIMFILYFFVYKHISLKTKCKLVKIERVKCVKKLLVIHFICKNLKLYILNVK
ncbi:hypothetical protein Hanom_Chr07g00612391 [Helianthus anomalus]